MLKIPREGDVAARRQSTWPKRDVFLLKVCDSLLGRLRGKGVTPRETWPSGAGVAGSRVVGADVGFCSPAAVVLQEALSSYGKSIRNQ